jgi:type II secretory pathway pseudopilin PulG
MPAMSTKSVLLLRPPSHRRRGYTLIEILVVTATIVILAVLLLPTLAKAKEKGQQIRCLTNMRQLMLATHLYASDFSNYLPFCGGSAFPLIHTNCWAYSRDPAGNHPEHAQLWPYHKSRGILMCPQENTNAPYFKPRFTPGHQAVTSYNFSTSSAGFPISRDGTNGWNKGLGLALTLFRVDAVLAWEPFENNLNLFDDAAIEPFEYCTTRHQGGGIVGFYGGGAEYMSYKVFALEEKRKPGRLWCNPNSPNGN